jgi:transitional endoplasmic reticulum ATPase
VEIKVVFRKNGSRDFAAALEYAERQPGFREEPPPGTYAVTFNQDQLQHYDGLMALVGRWAHTEVWLNGRPVERERLQRLLACYRGRLAACDRRAWCAGGAVHHTPVGPARQLFPCRLIPFSEANHQGWFQFGRLTREGVFLVDKGQLRQAVAESLRETLAEHCPALFPAEVDSVIDRLPDRIDPGRDPRWQLRYGWHNGRFVPVGVEKRIQPEGEPEAPPPAPPAASGAPVGPGGWPAAGGAGRGAEPSGPPGRGGGPVRPAGLTPVRYADIGGLEAQIRIVRENLELPLRFPELFARLGIQPHRGVLLSGPPGTGKTLLARALASESQASLFLINGPEILSKWRGESEANLRRVFEEARTHEPAVVLIDEIDAIAPDRSRVQHHHEAVLVSQLLTLLDGLAERGRVVGGATTNRPELVDPAVRRPGRLDLWLEIGPPDARAREEILRIHTRGMPLAPDVDLGALARRTEGFSGAHLSALCREAGLECIRGVVGLDAEGAFTLRTDDLERLEVRAEHFDRAWATVVRTVQA